MTDEIDFEKKLKKRTVNETEIENLIHKGRDLGLVEFRDQLNISISIYGKDAKIFFNTGYDGVDITTTYKTIETNEELDDRIVRSVRSKNAHRKKKDKKRAGDLLILRKLHKKLGISWNGEYENG
jgi:hypothetical protein